MTKRARGQQLGTIAVHGGEQGNRRDVDAPVVQPLYQSVNFIQEIGSAEGLRYPRYGNAPNAETVPPRCRTPVCPTTRSRLPSVPTPSPRTPSAG